MGQVACSFVYRRTYVVRANKEPDDQRSIPRLSLRNIPPTDNDKDKEAARKHKARMDAIKHQGWTKGRANRLQVACIGLEQGRVNASPRSRASESQGMVTVCSRYVLVSIMHLMRTQEKQSNPCRIRSHFTVFLIQIKYL